MRLLFERNNIVKVCVIVCCGQLGQTLFVNQETQSQQLFQNQYLVSMCQLVVLRQCDKSSVSESRLSIMDYVSYTEIFLNQSSYMLLMYF